MIDRRGFLGICGAVVGAAALPGVPAAEPKKAPCCDYKLTCHRYAKPRVGYSRVESRNPHNISVSELSGYVRPGVYLAHVK